MPDTAQRSRRPEPLRAEPEYLTVVEVATILGVGVPTVREWIYKGGLPAKKFGRHVRIPRPWLETWIREQPSIGKPV
jgi:excisionase family DNA binding protein